ncbi:MAG: two-component sensor histidine kinase [Archangium gephyra]|uniref:histidine kinase n=1 Tax=Archangium gephyra TaxID=48 RepID=A0A2W5T908_9BACT|nr:MAG: two-component sensor histidine kinase [Archangium gephyra]
MKLRLLLTSVVIAVVTVVATWLTMQPLLARAAAGGTWQRASSLVLGLDLVVAVLLILLVLQVTVGRPVTRLGEVVEQLVPGALDDGPLLVRLDVALRRLAAELSHERGASRGQLDELSRSHESLLRLQTELVAADRLATVGKLASGVAHEVGNPLSGILGYLSVIRMRHGSNAELIELVDRLEQEVQRIDQIVRSLLELGRPSRGRAEPVDVKPLVDSCVRLLRASRDFSSVKIVVTGVQSLWLRAEPGPLSQVLVNLLINGAQAMGGQGEIDVRLEQLEGGGAVIVDDRGPGLPDAVKARLFEPFFTTKPAGKGTGLGLAVSRHLLSQFDGSLDAGDRPGGGARFTIRLAGP